VLPLVPVRVTPAGAVGTVPGRRTAPPAAAGAVRVSVPDQADTSNSDRSKPWPTKGWAIAGITSLVADDATGWHPTKSMSNRSRHPEGRENETRSYFCWQGSSCSDDSIGLGGMTQPASAFAEPGAELVRQMPADLFLDRPRERGVRQCVRRPRADPRVVSRTTSFG